MRFDYDIAAAWGLGDDSRRAQHAGFFLSANTQDEYERLASDYPYLFGLMAPTQTPEDVRSVCELMRIANNLFALFHAPGLLELEDMFACGVTPVYSAVMDANTPLEEFTPDASALSFFRKVEGDTYARWLGRAAQTVAGRFPYSPHMVARFDNGFLAYDAPSRPAAGPDRAKEDCAEILSQLFNLHLVDIATVCDGATGNPGRAAYSGVSALWLGLSERMSGGRAFRCEACGKPVLAFGERRKGKYCCPACRKWGNAHPGKKRGHWYVEMH